MNEEIKNRVVELTDEEIEKTAGGIVGDFACKKCLNCPGIYNERYAKCPYCGCTEYLWIKRREL